ncbi:Metallo-dependent phosphatase [Xylariaceae sp. FL1651]|nr:Metallo-dependent phosphatase [Xylariaceae sp. FL1651]
MADPEARRRQQRTRTRSLVLAAIAFILCTILLYCVRFDTIPLPFTPQPGTVNQADKMADEMAAVESKHGTSYPHLSSLPPSLLPTRHDPDKKLIIIGDVHGHHKALKALLKKAGFSKSRGDHVIFTGDMVNKGDDSAGVVALAMDIGASGVRGNHEERVLGAWADYELKERNRGRRKHGVKANEEKRENGEPVPDAAPGSMLAKTHAQQAKYGEDEGSEEEEEKESQERNVQTDNEAIIASSRLKKPPGKSRAADLATAASLKPKHRAWLGRLPLILRVGYLGPRYGEVVVVHAGLVPGVPLPSQDPEAVMNMRTLLPPSSAAAKNADADVDTANANANAASTAPPMIPSASRDGTPWAKAWSAFQRSLPRGRGCTTVVYGHDSKAGLKMRKHAFGIDTGCGKGDTLTAVVFEVVAAATGEREGEEEDSEDGELEVERKGSPRIRHRLVSVSCVEVT